MNNGNDGATSAGALWFCERCQVWWGSQVGVEQKTEFLLRLPAVVIEPLGWEAYRGWRYADAASVCPQCGNPVTSPRVTIAA